MRIKKNLFYYEYHYGRKFYLLKNQLTTENVWEANTHYALVVQGHSNYLPDKVEARRTDPPPTITAFSLTPGQLFLQVARLFFSR